MTGDANRISAAAWLPLFALLTFFVASSVQAEPLPDWTGKIRSDHPRLFFNADTWPAVRDRALHEENRWYESIKGRVDRLANDLENVERPAARELGPEAAWAALIFLEQMDDMELVEEGTWRGVRLTCGGRTVTVTFDTAGDPKMRID
jgi:hypothetical protein